jgi:hypothetical protein
MSALPLIIAECCTSVAGAPDRLRSSGAPSYHRARPSAPMCKRCNLPTELPGTVSKSHYFNGGSVAVYRVGAAYAVAA